MHSSGQSVEAHVARASAKAAGGSAASLMGTNSVCLGVCTDPSAGATAYSRAPPSPSPGPQVPSARSAALFGSTSDSSLTQLDSLLSLFQTSGEKKVEGGVEIRSFY